MPSTSTHTTPDSRIRFHRLGFREDGDETIVGRTDSDNFIAIPHIGATAIRLMRDGLTPTEASTELANQTGNEIDLVPFVDGLAEQGLVTEIDGHQVSSPPPMHVTFPWLKPQHVAWAQSTLLPLILGGIIVAGLVTLVLNPHVIPHSTDFVWSEYNTLTMLGTATVAWTMLGLHESAHLITARAAGVPGRITLGTRLQFLVAQTNVTGIWLSPRRQRLTVYLGGIFSDLTLASLATMATITLWPLEGFERLLPLVMMLGVFPLIFQISVFMRTDLYFVLQDLLRCRNLYGDSSRYVRWQLARFRRVITAPLARKGSQQELGPDPSENLPPHERKTVRAYSWFMGTGIFAALAFFALVTVPVVLKFYGQAIGNITSGETVTILDGIGGILVFSFFQGLWVYAFVKRRRERQVATTGA